MVVRATTDKIVGFHRVIFDRIVWEYVLCSALFNPEGGKLLHVLQTSFPGLCLEMPVGPFSDWGLIWNSINHCKEGCFYIGMI